MRWQTTTMSRAELVRCARERMIVQLDNGTLGRLVRWDAPRQRGRARIELRPGTSITVPTRLVVAVLLGGSPETPPGSLRIDEKP